MLKMVNTSPKNYESDELDMDIPKQIEELSIRLNAELREKVKEHYNAVEKELKMLEAVSRSNSGGSEYTAGRKRFLTNLKGALDIYLNDKADGSVYNPALCIMAYFLECDGTLPTVLMGGNKVLDIENNSSNTMGVITTMFNLCHQLLAGIYSPGAIKTVLADILMDE